VSDFVDHRICDSANQLKFRKPVVQLFYWTNMHLRNPIMRSCWNHQLINQCVYLRLKPPHRLTQKDRQRQNQNDSSTNNHSILVIIKHVYNHTEKYACTCDLCVKSFTPFCVMRIIKCFDICCIVYHMLNRYLRLSYSGDLCSRRARQAHLFPAVSEHCDGTEQVANSHGQDVKVYWRSRHLRVCIATILINACLY